MWANTYVLADVIQNSISIAVGNAEAFNPDCVYLYHSWRAYASMQRRHEADCF